MQQLPHVRFVGAGFHDGEGTAAGRGVAVEIKLSTMRSSRGIGMGTASISLILRHAWKKLPR